MMMFRYNIDKKKISDLKVDERHDVKSRWVVTNTNGEEHIINKEDKSYSYVKTHRFLQSRDIQSGEVSYSKLRIKTIKFL